MAASTNREWCYPCWDPWHSRVLFFWCKLKLKLNFSAKGEVYSICSNGGWWNDGKARCMPKSNHLCADGPQTVLGDKVMTPHWLPTNKSCQPISFKCTWHKLPLAWQLHFSSHAICRSLQVWYDRFTLKGHKGENYPPPPLTLSSSYNTVQVHKCVSVYMHECVAFLLKRRRWRSG